MEKSKMTKAHLTLDDRMEIQQCLNCGMSFKAIAKRLVKDQTTISKEVKRNFIIKPTTTTRKDKTGKVVIGVSPLLLKAPFVCNSCKKKNPDCSFDRYLYYAKQAQEKYEEKLHSSREGIPLNKESFYEIDKMVSDGLQSGQHIYQIIKSNDICVSERTIYRHLHKGYFSANLIDAPRIVKFKPRNKKHEEYVPRGIKIGRTYAGYLAFMEEHPDLPVTEMDTVIGTIGGKVILTMILTDCGFMIGRLLPNKTTMSVSKEIKDIKNIFESNGYNFGTTFPIILTDNGREFSDVFTIENNKNEVQKTHLFFCDSMCAYQKPHVEKTIQFSEI